MQNIKTTSKLVKQALTDYPITRNSDDLLYLQVCYSISPSVMDMAFCDVFTNRNEYDLPPFESVRRARQKIQAHFPELRGCDAVEEARTELETVVRNFATA